MSSLRWTRKWVLTCCSNSFFVGVGKLHSWHDMFVEFVSWKDLIRLVTTQFWPRWKSSSSCKYQLKIFGILHSQLWGYYLVKEFWRAIFTRKSMKLNNVIACFIIKDRFKITVRTFEERRFGAAKFWKI